MAKIIPFPQAAKNISAVVDELLESKLHHHNPQVLHCLKQELKGVVAKHFTAEEYAATLILPPDLDDEQHQTINQNFQKLFQEHNEKMLQRTNALFLDLCLSRMTICELVVKNFPQKH